MQWILDCLKLTKHNFRFQLILIYLPFAYIVLLWPCFACYKWIKTKELKDGSYIKRFIKFVDEDLLNEDTTQKVKEGSHKI